MVCSVSFQPSLSAKVAVARGALLVPVGVVGVHAGRGDALDGEAALGPAAPARASIDLPWPARAAQAA